MHGSWRHSAGSGDIPKVTDLPGRVFSIRERENWLASIFDIYERMRAKGCEPYEMECDGLSLIVLPNVYAPNFFTDSMWFAQQLPDLVGNGSLLEIGTGTGIISLFCARSGARVVASDVNPDAVRNARMNATRHKLNISVREGCVYRSLEPNEKFDCIFWAHPFNNWGMPVLDMLLRSGLDFNYEGLRDYIGGARNHLTKAGRLLLGTGDSADLATISAIAAENGFVIRILRQDEMPLEIGQGKTVRYLICEFDQTRG